MPYNVQLPDGRIVEGIPDDVSQVDAKKRILEAFPDIAAKEKRGWGEAITDLGAGLAKGVGQLAQVPGQLTQLAGLTTAEDSDKGIQGLGKQLEQFGEENKSAVLKGKEAMRAQKIDKADGMLAEFGTAIKETIKDPALLTSFFAEQLPNLAGSWGGGLLARGATKALMSEAVKTSLGASGVAEKLGKVGVRGAVGAGAVMQGADIGSETYELAYKEAKKQGMDDEQANGIALAKGRVAAIEAAALSIAVTKLPGGTTIEKAMAGKGLPTVGGVAKGFLGEAASEGLEEGGGKFASNVGVQEVNPETSLTKGVGSAAGMGALGGGFFGGVAGYTESRAQAAEDQRIQDIEAQKQAVQDLIDQAAAAEDQARRDAFEAEQAQIRIRALEEAAPERFKESKAYAELQATVDKAIASRDKAEQVKADAIARQDEIKAKESAFSYVEPNAEGIMEPSRPITEADFKAMNIGATNKKLREQLIGKDLSDPKVAKEVKAALEDYAGGNRSAKIIEGVTGFLDLPEFSVPEPKKRTRKPKAVAEQQLVPEEVTQEVVKPKRRMKALKPTAEEALSAEEQQSLQDELNAELENEQATIDQQSAGKTPAVISGASKPSVRVPSDGLGATTGTEQSKRRGMVPVGDVTGQPIGGEAPVASALEPTAEEDFATQKKLIAKVNKARKELSRAEDFSSTSKAKLAVEKAEAEYDVFEAEARPRADKRIAELTKDLPKEAPALNASPEEEIRPSGQTPAKPILLEPGVTLSTRHAREYKEAAANYLEKANYIGQRALENVAGDLYSGENLKDAKRFHRGLSEAQKGFVQKKLDELKKWDRRGTAYSKQHDKTLEAKRAFQEELDQEEEVKAEPKKKAKKTNPKLERIDAGKTNEALTNAVRAGNLNAALNAIAKDTSDTFNILEKLVSNRLLANKGSLPKIEIVPAGTIQDGAAQYNPFTDTVQINEGEVDSHTVLHETTHGFLHALIQKFELEGAKNKGISDLKDLYEFVKQNHPNVAKEYGMESLTEFASELMSNRQFQETLAQIPYRTESQSLFTAFVRAVLSALGLSPTQKLSALASGLIAADRTLAIGRKIQEDVVTGKETMPNVKVARTADLNALYAATGAGSRAKSTVETGPFQSFVNTAKGTVTTKQGFARFLNTAETMLFSADAALNNAIRNGLESGGKSWDTIKQMMFDISTAQATHADAVAMQFLEKGDVVYDEQVRKWVAKDNKDSWAGLVNQISEIAKKYNLDFDTMNNYAQEAFVAERLKGLSKADRSVYSHKTPEQIEAGVKFFEMVPELREVQKSWNAVRKNAMNVAVQGGLYSEKQAEELLNIMDYVPFYRIEQLAQNAGPKEYGRGLIDFAKGFKLQGSEQEVANIFDNMERWTSYTVSRAVKNRTALNLYNTAKELFPEEVKDLRQDERVHREQNTIDLWIDGNRRKVEFKDPLFIHAFNGIEAAAIPHFGAASAVANFLRKNIVLMPLFSISQLSQDSFGAMLTSGLKHPWLLPLEVAKEFTNTLRGRSAAAKELTKYGAVGVRDYSATMVRDTAEIMAGLKKETKAGKVGSFLEKFAMASDNAVRQAIYNMTMKETGDKALAVERAFEIINFKRAGASGKIQMMRQVVPFFGAYLQAQNVVYKVVTGKGIAPQQKKEALRVLASNALKISALAFMYAAIASDDEDYQKMDPQIRDRHLLIPGTAFMLPLRSDLTLLPKLIAEYTYLGMTDNAFTDGKKIRRAMGTALFNAVASPTAVPQAFKPALEVATNFDFFTGRSIIGQGIANKITEEQYTNNTSELGKLIGKTGMIAPVNVDHLIKGYLGTTGGLGLMVTNWVVNGAKDQPKPEKSWQDAIATTPGLSAFVAREYGNADKNDFYELREEVDKINTTLNAMKKQGRKEDYKELLAENKDLMKVKTQVNNIGRQLTKLREYENHIYDLPEAKMTAEKKGVEVRRIREQEKKLLKNVHDLRIKAGY